MLPWQLTASPGRPPIRLFFPPALQWPALCEATMDVGSSTIYFFFIYTFSYVLFLGPRDGLHFRSCDRTWLPVRRTEGSRTPHHAGTGVGKQVLLLVLYISQSITPQAPLRKPVYGGTRGDLFHPCCPILRSLTLVAFCALPLPLDCFFPSDLCGWGCAAHWCGACVFRDICPAGAAIVPLWFVVFYHCPPASFTRSLLSPPCPAFCCGI